MCLSKYILLNEVFKESSGSILDTLFMTVPDKEMGKEVFLKVDLNRQPSPEK